MFVDNSGRRARLLRRIGLLLGALCLGYAAVLGAAFMGWGTSLTPSQLLPFAGAGPGTGPGGGRPEEVPGGLDGPGARPSGVPSAPAGEAASGATSSPSSSPSPSPSASAGAN
ncbi:hypothetical protein ACFWJ5_15485 [Streptomyces qaidamensis]|uniref:hypothetical protein n=1 Tax=Streptomyces qaidamensis TaxID=1783515 RepID=UPI003667A26F